MSASKSVWVVPSLVAATLLIVTGCKSTPETRTHAARNPEQVVADYWQARVAFWKSSDRLLPTHSQVSSGAMRVSELQEEIEATVPLETRRLLLAKGLVPLMLEFLAERAFLSDSYTSDHPAVRVSERIVDRLSEEYLVLRSGLSSSQIQDLDRTVHDAIVAEMQSLEIQAKAASERYTADHPRVKEISAKIAAVKDAGKTFLIAER